MKYLDMTVVFELLTYTFPWYQRYYQKSSTGDLWPEQMVMFVIWWKLKLLGKMLGKKWLDGRKQHDYRLKMEGDKLSHILYIYINEIQKQMSLV
jgi:hypothetical protein